MSYISWRKENEDKFLEKINDGEVILCLEESSKSKLTDELITPVVDEMLGKKYLNAISFPVLFAEYLFETYHISPADAEILCQCGMRAALQTCSESAYKAGAMVGEILRQVKEQENERDGSE